MYARFGLLVCLFLCLAGMPGAAAGGAVSPPGAAGPASLEGPVMWVVGRPATFHLRFTPPPGLVPVRVTYVPGKVFRTAWRRPGRHRVRGFVVVRYLIPTPRGPRALTVTHGAEARVEVLAGVLVGGVGEGLAEGAGQGGRVFHRPRQVSPRQRKARGGGAASDGHMDAQL